MGRCSQALQMVSIFVGRGEPRRFGSVRQQRYQMLVRPTGRSISSLRGPSNHCSRVQILRQTSLVEDSCRQRSKAHPPRYPDHPHPYPRPWKQVVEASYSVLMSRLRAHCRKWHTLRTAPRSMFSRFSCQISLLELCNKRSMACSCFDYSMLCSTMSHLGPHIWQLSSGYPWVFEARWFFFLGFVLLMLRSNCSNLQW